MKLYFIILVGLVLSCKAQKNTTTNLITDSIQYFSYTCSRYSDYTRKYLNDTVYVEQHGDVADTLILKGGSLYILHRQAIYKIIDAEDDFSSNEKKYRYYYYGLSSTDTLPKKGESDVQYKLRLQQSIVIYVPVRVVRMSGREMFMYYTFGDCYPATSDKCVQSKIINGQYGVVYFEKGIGRTGYAAGGSKCKFIITDKSYKRLLQRKSKLLR